VAYTQVTEFRPAARMAADRIVHWNNW
jgi:hypothetical protein